MDSIFNDIYVFIFVMLRIIGFIVFNPVLSRRNVPVTAKAGLSFIMSLLYVSVNTPEPVVVKGYFDFGFMAVKELAIGYIIGYIMNIFIGVVVTGGEIIDYQLGLTMGKVYDPINGTQISVTAVLLNTMFVIFFFQSGAYISFIKMFWSSYEILPIGFDIIKQELVVHIIKLFSNMYVLAVQLSVPIIAAHIITEMAVGVLMKAVPQINIFVVNMQIKIVMGVLVFFVVLTPISRFVNGTVNLMMTAIDTALRLLG